MDTPMMSVTCSVTNCHYNKEKLCHADKLEVNPMGDNHVESCAGTQCSTFMHHNVAVAN